MKGIILEGVSTVGKSTISNFVRELLVHEKPSSSLFFLSEHYTQRSLEHLKEKTSIPEIILERHLNFILDTLAFYKNSLEQSKFKESPGNAEMYVVAERFIITHLIDSCILNEEIQNHILKRLNDLNFIYIVLKIPDEEIYERIKTSIEHRNQNWKNFLLSKYGSIELLTEHYIEWQNKCLKYAEKFTTIMDIRVIEVPKDSYKNKAKEIFDMIV